MTATRGTSEIPEDQETMQVFYYENQGHAPAQNFITCAATEAHALGQVVQAMTKELNEQNTELRDIVLVERFPIDSVIQVRGIISVV